MKIGPFLTEIRPKMLIFVSRVPPKPRGAFIGEFTVDKVSFDMPHKKTDLKVFWYDTDFLKFESFDFIDHIL